MRIPVLKGMGTTVTRLRPSGLENSADWNGRISPSACPKKSPSGALTAGVRGAIPEHLDADPPQHRGGPIAQRDPDAPHHSARAGCFRQHHTPASGDRDERRAFAARVRLAASAAGAGGILGTRPAGLDSIGQRIERLRVGPSSADSAVRTSMSPIPRTMNPPAVCERHGLQTSGSNDASDLQRWRTAVTFCHVPRPTI